MQILLKNKKHIQGVAIPLSIFVSILCVSFVPTAARFSDTEASEGNVFNAGTIDLSLDVSSEGANTRTFVLSNGSSAPLDYHVRVASVSESSFCESISVSTGGEGGGALLSYTASGFLGIGEEESLVLEFAHDASGGTPESVCKVNVVAEATQSGGTHGSGFYDTEVREVALTGADFGILGVQSVPPLPLESPTSTEPTPSLEDAAPPVLEGADEGDGPPLGGEGSAPEIDEETYE